MRGRPERPEKSDHSRRRVRTELDKGIEFDYCCVHAAYSLREAGIETIMVNCNPETVSTDYDTSDRLYFEPLTAEDVVEIVRAEERHGTLLGVIVQFGGQTPLKLAAALEREQIPILGTSPDAIDLAEDRSRFEGLLRRLGLRRAMNGTACSAAEAEEIALRIGYPVVIRPSYVLGGRAMEIVHDVAGLHRYMRQAVSASGSSPVLIDRYLQNAIEVDVDAVSDGRTVEVAGIMEHIEEAGIHSGDSACSLPPYSLEPDTIAEIERQTVVLARALDVVGLMNVQFAVKDHEIYVLEVNPRASRTVPFRRQGDRRTDRQDRGTGDGGRALRGGPLRCHCGHPGGHVAVKEAVFPFARFPGVDLILGPEMKSTGEVMGLDTDFGRAFREVATRQRHQPAIRGSRLRLGQRSRQASARRALPAARRDGVCAGRHRTEPPEPSPRNAFRSSSRQQSQRGASAHRRLDAQRRRPTRFQHDRGRAGDRRQLQPATHGVDQRHPLLHDRRRCSGGGAGDQGFARRQP